MTAILDRPIVETADDTDDGQRCECRRSGKGCSRNATWLYTMKCCRAVTLVCDHHHAEHLSIIGKPWTCIWCRQVGNVAQIVAEMRRL